MLFSGNWAHPKVIQSRPRTGSFAGSRQVCYHNAKNELISNVAVAIYDLKSEISHSIFVSGLEIRRTDRSEVASDPSALTFGIHIHVRIYF